MMNITQYAYDPARDLESLPRRISPEDVPSTTLAPLIWPLMLNPRLKAEFVRSLHDRLLDITIRQANANVPWYQNTLPGPEFHTTYESLQSLPTISREIVTSNSDKFISPLTHFGFASFTSGTTDKKPLVIQRCIEEQKYLSELHTLLLLAKESNEKRFSLGLTAANMSHGHMFSIPGKDYSFTLNFHQETAYKRGAYLLSQEFNFPKFNNRISFISGYFQDIHSFTHYLKQINFDINQNLIKKISCFGMHVTKARRLDVSEYFGCPVDENFSLSEIYGFASYNHNDESFAYCPMVTPEILDPWSNKRIQNGSGELVLTSLYPFTQRFPLIRYRTGDIVSISGHTDWGPKFKWRGRMDNSYNLGGSHFLCQEEIQEALESHSAVARMPFLGPDIVLEGERTTEANVTLSSKEGGGALVTITLKRKAAQKIRSESEISSVSIDLREKILEKTSKEIREILTEKPDLLTLEIKMQR